jgi:hypothetical protein
MIFDLFQSILSFVSAVVWPILNLLFAYFWVSVGLLIVALAVGWRFFKGHRPSPRSTSANKKLSA